MNVCVCVCVCPQLSSTSSWLGVGNVICAAKSTQELIVLIIAVRSSPGIIGMLPFLGFATQDWYRLARETDRHFCLSVAFWAPLYHDCIIVGGFKVQGVCVCDSLTWECRSMQLGPWGLVHHQKDCTLRIEKLLIEVREKFVAIFR